MKELNKPKEYNDDAIYKTFCPYDGKDSTARLCATIINESKACVEIIPPINRKKNILLYSGALTNNHTTCNFLYMLDHLNISDNNYCVSFLNTKFRSDSIRLQCIDKNFDIISIDSFEGSFIYPTISVKLALYLWKRYNCFRHLLEEKVRTFYIKEFNRQFWNIHWDKIIRFGGLDIESLSLFIFAPVKEKYIFLYDEMYRIEDRLFKQLLVEAQKNDCHLIQVKNNNILTPVYEGTRIAEELNCFKNYESS